MAEEIAQGVLVVDKPSGWTSHDVVARLRALLGIKRVGHTGSLDPLATGVLVICLGKATRIIPYLDEHQKEYVAEIRLGASTDTYDAEGRQVRRYEGPAVARGDVDAACERFVGEIQQIPPMFSAVKVGGQPLYRLARKGQTIERAPRKVTVFELTVLEYAFPRLLVRVLCSKGTYVRSLAYDLGERLGCGGYLAALRRLRSGRFRIGGALTLERIAEAAEAGALAEVVVPTHEALDHYAACCLADEDVGRFRCGVAVPWGGQAAPGSLVRVFDGQHTFHGLGRVEDRRLIRPVSVLT